MASERQVSANRRNASFSTGPRTVTGKLRSRRNAFKHGLTGRSVIDVYESRTDFQAFQDGIAAAYRPRSLLDQGLINRLGALLWRLQRAQAIETGLLSIQAAIQSDRRHDPENPASPEQSFPLDTSDPIQLAHAFLRASNLNGEVLDRLSRYETTLWRQAVQLLFLLEAIAKPATPRMK